MKIIVAIVILLVSSLPNVLCADIRIVWDDEKKFKNVLDGAFIVDPLVEFIEKDRAIDQIFIMPADGRISSMFGWRRDPFSGSPRLHSGIDIANIRSSNIHSAADGLVSFSGYARGCGIMVVVEHSDDLDTRYCHLGSAIAGKGERVESGEIIGFMGSTGRSTGVHLHFEVRRNGVPEDPARHIVLVR